MSESVILGEKYKIIKKIDEGAYGKVYLAIDIISNEEVAVKFVSLRSPTLYFEKTVSEKLSGSEGVPKVRWYGIYKGFGALVMDRLGPSLHHLFHNHKKFSLTTVALLADQMISRVKYAHSMGFIHRDLKPDNFVMGVDNNSNIVYLIDFGLGKKFRDQETRVHIEYSENVEFVGNIMFSSINSHFGIEQSRRDDMESLGYILIYFARGNLPWENVKTSKSRREKTVVNRKVTTSIKELCNGLPSEFSKFLEHCRGLKFKEAPNYIYLRQLFKGLYNKVKGNSDQFDWIEKDKKDETREDVSTSAIPKTSKK